MKLSTSDIRELNLLKYYRLIRKWACKTHDLKDADLELLVYFATRFIIIWSLIIP